jgi:putative two-component system response regulator
MRILIADDNPIALAVLEAELLSEGHQVEIARDGREALNLLRQGTCRLVISDWEMPVMNGLEFCRAVRAADFPDYVYVILLTTRGSRSDIIEGLSAGADDFLVKPFDPDELRVRIRTGQRILSREMFALTIFALAKLAESRDPETGAHLERVRLYAQTLARHLAGDPHYAPDVDGNYVRLIYLTAPLHDIGKVAIPDTVLLKEGKLTPEEFGIMKTHALHGARTLDAALKEYPDATFLRMARDIAAAHHERFDGTGYPYGLKGKDIPLAARIVAIADVYDALISKRRYKDAFSHDKAAAIITESAGTHFDPDLVAAFQSVDGEFARIAAANQG